MKRYTKPLILLSLMAAIVLLDRYYGWSDFLSGPGGLEALNTFNDDRGFNTFFSEFFNFFNC